MADLIRQEQFLGSRKNIVGDKSTDLVLETIGKVYIKTQNKSRLLNELFTAIDNLEEGTNIMILENSQTIQNIEYPGDNKLVYDPTLGILYITLNNEYIPLVDKSSGDSYVNKKGDTMTGQLTIELEDSSVPPLIINSKVLIPNLNAELLNGMSSDEYAIKNKNEAINGEWTFNNNTTFTGNTTHVDSYYKGNLESASGFAPGMSGYGWQMNTLTNTLTVDNLIVRKVLTFNDEAESSTASLIVTGTNGSVWVRESITVSNIDSVLIDETSEITKVTAQGTRNSYTLGTIEEISSDPVELHSGDFNYDNNYNETYNYWDYFQGEYFYLELSSEDVKVNDIFRCYRGPQKIYYDCVVTNITETLIIVRCSTLNNNTYTKLPNKIKTVESFSSDLVEEPEEETEEETEDFSYITTPDIGDTLVKIGNLSGETGLYQTWIEDDSPSMLLYEKIDTPNYKELKEVKEIVIDPETGTESEVIHTVNNLSAKVGVLENIYDPILEPKGVGIYCKNSFVKGDWFVGTETNGWLATNRSITYIKAKVPAGLILNENGQIDSFSKEFDLFTENVKFPATLQSDWNEEDITKPSFILNKPSIYLKSEIDQLFVTNQADWNTTDTSSPSYIKNKPDVAALGSWKTTRLTATVEGFQFVFSFKRNDALKMYLGTLTFPSGAMEHDWTGDNYTGTDIFSGSSWMNLWSGIDIRYTTCIQNTPEYAEHNRGINLYVSNSSLKLCGQSCNTAQMAMGYLDYYHTFTGPYSLY